jgi:pyruvate decarboxylase
VSRPDVKERIETAELILFVGGLISDFNSGGFTFHISRAKTVEFHSDHMKVRYSEFPSITMKYVLQQLIKEVDMTKVRATETIEITNVLPKRERESISQEITHAWLWPTIGQWLKAKDVVITETGTANFGILETRFQEDVVGISQVLWGSIGYSVGALQGAALAVKEQKKERRVILFVGDGSLQLTVQEISTMLRHGLTPIIFVINNQGYTIERKIHGPNESYNDIQPWCHTKLFDVFGADSSKTKTYQIKTRTELNKLLADKEFSDAKKIQMVELFMPKHDAPRALEVTAEAAAKLNSQLSS